MNKTFVIIYMLVLFVLHQDFWLKDNPSLVFGVLPATLAYHMLFTALATFGWFLAVKFAWPTFEEDDDN